MLPVDEGEGRRRNRRPNWEDCRVPYGQAKSWRELLPNLHKIILSIIYNHNPPRCRRQKRGHARDHVTNFVGCHLAVNQSFVSIL